MTHDVALWLNRIGLLVGIAGVIITFIWGPPQPDFGGDRLLLESSDDSGEREKKRYELRSKSGFILIALGFALQFFATFE